MLGGKRNRGRGLSPQSPLEEEGSIVFCPVPPSPNKNKAGARLQSSASQRMPAGWGGGGGGHLRTLGNTGCLSVTLADLSESRKIQTESRPTALR